MPFTVPDGVVDHDEEARATKSANGLALRKEAEEVKMAVRWMKELAKLRAGRADS